MAKFITRVELHDATSADYTKLHQEMKKQGFLQEIKAATKKLHTLPTAEYYRETNIGIAQVYNEAVEAAGATGKTFWVIVSEIVNSYFDLPIA